MPAMKTLTIALLFAAAPALADVHIHDNKKTLTVDCAKDKIVMIHGNDAVITLKGTCEGLVISGNKAKVTGSVTKVGVSGNKNTLELDATLDVNVSGNDNTVSYKKSTDDKKPVAVANSGKNNKIAHAK
jgi:hypothetical protein